MAGTFELVAADNDRVRILLVNGTGNVLAVSGTYRDKAAAAAGVMAIREHAATAHIADRVSAPGPNSRSDPLLDPLQRDH
ncbi:YegP family protein [Pseudarthrobacter sp. N5]|uniref:YegP family protein n=1 Tax=Pseudarthrobacter sp. N5 TaxID=3418416 RepID=UPI003CF828A5